MTLILVATDGSEGADRAIDFAAQQASSENADLVIVNVIGGYGIPDQLVRAFTRSQHAWLEEQLASLSKAALTKARDRARDAGAATIHLESRTGDVVQTILDVAHEKGADGIVVGKRGAGRVSGLLLGSVSQKLISLADVPITIVP